MTPTTIQRRLWTETYLLGAGAAAAALFFTGRLGVDDAPLVPVALAALPALFLLGRGVVRFRSILLLLLVLVLAVGRHATDRSGVAEGEESAEADAYAAVQSAFAARVDSLLRWTGDAASDDELVTLVRGDMDRRERLELFRLLAGRGEAIRAAQEGEDVTLEVFGDGAGEPAAWWGEVPDLTEPVKRSVVRLADDPLRVHLVVESPIRLSGRRTPGGLVRAVVPIGTNPEIAGKAGETVAFTRALEAKTGGEVIFFLPGAGGAKALRAPDGSEIGRMEVRLPGPDARRETARRRGAAAVALLLALLGAASLPWRLRPRRASGGDEENEPLRERASRIPVLPIVGTRLLLLLFDLPGRFGDRTLAGPDLFASPLGFGLLRSPADLLLTTLALLAVLLILRERAVARIEPARAPAFRALPMAGLFLLVSAAAGLFGLLVREILFSTTLPLFDGPNPIGPAPVMVLELSIFLLASAYLLLLDACFLAAGRFGWSGRRLAAGLALSTRLLLVLLCAAAVLLLTRAEIRGGPFLVALPAAGVATGLLVLFLLRGRGWRVWNGFGFVMAVAIVSYPHLSAAREEATRLRLEEKALDFAETRDEWKRFLLEETLRFFSGDSVLIDKLGRDPMPPMDREAFLAWVRSGLSKYDYSVELRILDRQGAVVSRFALDMPSESPVRAAFVFRDVRASGGSRIYDERRRFAGESVEIYTGAVPLTRDGELLGAVVVSIPYFYESLEHATRLPDRSYEILRANRLARPGLEAGEPGLQVVVYRDGEVVRSTSDRFPAETTIPDPFAAEIATTGGAWGRLTIDDRPYKAFFTPWRDPEREGIVAFAVPVRGLVDHGLSLIDTMLTDLFFALAAFLVAFPVVAFLSLRRPGRGRRFEPTFQDKLVLALLVVALLPAVLLGGAGRRMIASQLREAGESEARASLQAVLSALDRDGTREAEELAQSTLVRRRVLGVEEGDEMVDLELSLKRFAIFSPDGDLILQNGKVGPVDREAIAEVREKRTPTTAFQISDGLTLTALVGITLEGLEEELEGILMLSRPIDEEWTALLGERVGKDISFYENGTIRSSTRFELFQAGILPPRLPASVYASLELKGEEVRFGRENVAGAPYLVGYGVLRDFQGEPVGTAAVPLLFREREARRDQDRAYAAITYLTFLVLLVIVVTAEAMGQRIARPVAELSRGMNRITSGDLELRLPVRSGGEIGKLVLAFNRMTEELKRSRDALTERTRYIETILGSVGAGVIAFDREGRIASANPAASRVLGVPLEELMGARLEWIAAGRLEPLHRIVSRVEPGADRIVEDEAELARPGGRATLRVVATAIVDGSGANQGSVIVFEDLSDLIQSKKLLAWGEMARQVAHEIKNPLTPMKLSVQHLKQAYHDRHERFGELLDESADLIIEEIGSLQRIAAEFSTFARMPRREIGPVPAAALLRDALRLYEEGFPDLRIDVDVPEDLPLLQVDREEVRRLLINLIENAVQATGARGRLGIAARVEEGSPRNREGWKLWEVTSEVGSGGPVLVVRIVDDGPGVSESARGKLFEPNFSTKTDGTGLGLAICRAIIEDYGGTIAIGSTPGEGTAAIVAFPLTEGL